MARLNVDNWIPEERGSSVLEAVAQNSAVEALATRENMGTDAKVIPSVNGIAVSIVQKGAAYPEDVTTDGEVTLKARKFGTAIRIADEDLKDSPVDILAAKQRAWATAYAVKLDNAALATTGVENGSTVPFTSVYAAVAAGKAANITKTAGAVTYDHLSNMLSAIEGSQFASGEVAIIAHPFFKSALRNLKDTNGSPLFVQGLAGTPDTVFGYRVVWSRGAKTSATASEAPAGNALMIAVNPDHLLLGVRSGPESAFAPADSGAAFLTDEALLKMRSRRAFTLGSAEAAAIIEVTAKV